MNEFHEIFGLKNGLIPLVTVFVSLVLLKSRFIGIVLKTARRDVLAMWRLLPAAALLKWAKIKNDGVGSFFDRNVAKNPDKVCFYFQEEKWTLKQVQDLANKVGNHFLSLGYKKGDVVGIFMESCVDYVPLWLGLSKVGVVSALINSNLRMQPLQHSIQVVDAKALIYAEDLSDAVEELVKMGKFPGLSMFSYTKKGGKVNLPSAKNLVSELDKSSTSQPVPKSPINYSDNLFYIYTSGTTGLPKAAIIKHARFLMAGLSFRHVNVVNPKDIVYNSLPLYHSAGGIMGVSQPLLFGTPLVVRKKFSATHFWTDCVKHDVTIILYIGEICRYLLAQPRKPEETRHKLRIMFGNGLRKEIWTEFVGRFGIPNVTEMYASTEGNCNLLQFDGETGAVGFIPRLMYPFFPVKLLKVDEKTGEIARDPKTGRAIVCGFDEPGELVGKIIKNHTLREFGGYADKEESRKKIANNVFKDGDSWFRSGDIMTMDEFGYFYFKDRSGDTFRWKGENVSTKEVEGIVSNLCDLRDSVVYGVQIPNTDGRAGMATICDPKKNLNFDQLVQGLVKTLPTYAIPIFLRVTAKPLDITGTYKMKKTDLQREGFDLRQVQDDDLYIFQKGQYVPLTPQLHEAVTSGKIRL